MLCDIFSLICSACVCVRTLTAYGEIPWSAVLDKVDGLTDELDLEFDMDVAFGVTPLRVVFLSFSGFTEVSLVAEELSLVSLASLTGDRLPVRRVGESDAGRLGNLPLTAVVFPLAGSFIVLTGLIELVRRSLAPDVASPPFVLPSYTILKLLAVCRGRSGFPFLAFSKHSMTMSGKTK